MASCSVAMLGYLPEEVSGLTHRQGHCVRAAAVQGSTITVLVRQDDSTTRVFAYDEVLRSAGRVSSSEYSRVADHEG